MRGRISFQVHEPHAFGLGEGGIALLMCIFALLLMTSMALGLLYMSDSDTQIAANYSASQQAYFAARAGIEEARDRLRPTAPSSLALPATMPTLTGGVLYVLNPAGAGDPVQPWNPNNPYFDTELCQENFVNLNLTVPGAGKPCINVPSGLTWYSFANSTAPFNNTPAAMSYKWVRITLKGNGSNAPYYTNGSSASATISNQICWNGTAEVALPAGTLTCQLLGQGYVPVYLLTSLAVTRSGARRMMQTESALMQLPPLPAGLTFDGPNPSFTPPPHSNNFGVSGKDARSCGGAALASVPAIGVWDAASIASITTAIPTNRVGNYIGSGAAAPDVENVSLIEASQWKSVDGLTSIVSMLTGLANPSNIYAGSQSDIALGSDAAPQITVVNGDLAMYGNTSGAGILLVTGNLTFHGKTSFDGIILAIGKGYFGVSGGGSGQFNGSLFVARTLDGNGNPLPSGSAPGSPTVDWSGGGGNGILYDSCYLSSLNNLFYYKELATHELPF